jgi:Lar family restriction alleviation protein
MNDNFIINEALECPFCGSTATADAFNLYDDKELMWGVKCDNCNAYIGDFETRTQALKAWNSREKYLC